MRRVQSRVRMRRTVAIRGPLATTLVLCGSMALPATSEATDSCAAAALSLFRRQLGDEHPAVRNIELHADLSFLGSREMRVLELEELPYVKETGGGYIVHGTIHNPQVWRLLVDCDRSQAYQVIGSDPS